jgi:Na+-driven multidrug efflux pump
VATAISAGAGLLVFLYLLLLRRRNVVRLRFSYLWPRVATVAEVLRVGVPSSVAQLAMALGALFMNRAVASFGDEALAGFGIGSRINTIVGMPILGLASGTVAVIGMFAGAGRVDLIRQTASYVFRWAVGIATVIGVLAFSGSGLVLRVFTDDTATIAVGQHYLLYMLFLYPMMGFGMMSARLLLGLGYPMLSMLITSVRMLLVAVPIAYLAVFVLGTSIDGVWVGLLAGALVSTGVAAALVRAVIWVGDPSARATRGGPVPEPTEAEVAVES